MKKVKQLLSLLMAMVLMFSYQSIFAQASTTAAINGLVVDQNGNPLPGANIIAVHEPSGTQYGSTSRSDGRYNLVGLRTGGPYKVTVSYVGYTSQVEEGFSLALSQNLRIDFKLPEQAVQLSGVTVTAEKGAVMSQARTGSDQNVSARQIQEIPTISRAFQDFAKMSPLFSGINSQVAGRKERYNNIQIDGSSYNDLFGLGSTGLPAGQTGNTGISLDAIQEFQVVVAPFDVTYGGFTGGGINAITRSGTNNFAGSAYFFGRNQSLVGDDYDGTHTNDFKDYQYGFRLGGPIQKDKLFFFLSGEMTNYSYPSVNNALTSGPSNVMDLTNRFISIMKSKYFDPGSYGEFNVEQPSTKLFLRFDYNLADNHKLTVRHSYLDAYNDNLNNRTSNNRLSFDTYNYRIKNKTNSTVVQLSSTFSNKLSNELILGYTTIKDRRAGTSADLPEFQVDGAVQFNAGPDRYSSANELDQTVFELTDNLTYYTGSHAITVGTHNEFFSFRNLFIRSFFGIYEFYSLDDLEAGNVGFYQRVFSRTGDPRQAAEFSVNQFGFYAQDEWTASERLKLTFGVRVDVPIYPEAPLANPLVAQNFPGYQTDKAPSGNLLWSPRFGFNYDLSGDRTTQFRGGLGVFTGRIPYVWISNNYGGSGVLYAEIRGSGTSLPISVNPNNQPGVGDPGTGSPSLISEIDIAEPDLKMPQVLRLDLALDHQLPMGFIGTVEFMYSKTVNDMIYKKLNIKPQVGTISGVGSGVDDRPLYGGTDSKGGNFYDVLDLYNTSDGYTYNLVFQLQKNVARGLSINAAYTLGRAKDRNSVNSSQARSQMRYNPIDGDPNNPKLTTSQYQIDNRIFASIAYSHEFFANAPTTVSLFYNGQTGAPFSFIYYGDVNNDGFDQNDLFYIPRNSSEILLGSVSNGQYIPASASDYAALESFINNNDYLKGHKGQIAERNGARNPWYNSLDVRIAQVIPDLWGMGRFQVSLDILNFLNLLNKDWGRDDYVFSTYTIASLRGRIDYNGKPNTPVYSVGLPRTNVPWSTQRAESRWAMQLGVRYSF